MVTIEAFLTTYPNKIHKNFNETFLFYCKIIDEEFLIKKFDIFTCSVGAYGILLCNYVNNKYGTTSIYIGHIINFIFGILSERNINDSSINTQYYEKSDLNERYLNIDKIENNRYG